jgi:Fungalysin metallopeptidase (M36)
MSTMTVNGAKTIMGKWYGTPTELWGFRVNGGGSRSPASVARRFLEANQEGLGLRGVRLGVRPPRIIESLGAWHVILRQTVRRIPVHRAYVSVHISRDRHVYLVKSRAVPVEFAKPGALFRMGADRALELAKRSVAVTGRRGLRAVDRVDRVWYPYHTKTRPMELRPAYKVHLLRPRPRADWIILIDAATGRVLYKYDNLTEATGVARVFDPNPVITLDGSGDLLDERGRLRPPPADAYVTVRLTDLRNGGQLDGRRVSTRATRDRVVHPDRRFEFPSTSAGFEEVMAYFHVDRAVHYLESLGFNGRRAIFRAPIVVNARGTREDNSAYSPHDRSLMFGTGGVDDAEDADIILHEFGHAIQDAICPQFGQSDEAAAMGEGFGDYFAASFFADQKSPRFLTSIGTWDGVQEPAVGDEPPCVRRVDSRLTYEQFDHGVEADEHDNGQIWSATLWDIWTAVDRDVADRIILESHFQLDGFSTFARGARAILDADRNLYRGRHTSTLRQIFHRRGIGPVV